MAQSTSSSMMNYNVMTYIFPNSPDITIQKSLAISVDALQSDDPLLKKFFLDKDWVVRRMESYYSYADHYIDILKKRCLLTINDKDQLGMHDLLRDMGREIGRNNYPDNPGKHSRLYASEEICDVLKKKKGTKAIEGIYLSRNYYKKDVLEGMSLDVETFKKMSKLRFLCLESAVSITGNFEQAFEDLRWLCWKYCPLEHLPSNFFPQKLGILELPYSRMRTMWEPQLVTQVLEKLKTLNISYSLDLTTTPDFTKLPCVETLDLEGCKSLVEIHVSIGSLAKLSSLNLCGCVKVRSLPDGICNLRALESFNIGGCSSLEALPSKMGNMKSLTELVAYGLSVSRLPNSIGDLHKLLKLILYSSTNLETLPDSICNLRVLEVLDISDCYNLKALPIELGNIKSLKELNVKCLDVSKIPDSIGRLSKVVELNLICNMYLKTIPNTICNMRSLEILNISECAELEILPNQLWEITRLRELHASYATMLTKLPNIESSHIATLTLQELDLSESILTSLPSGTSQLLKLQDLNVRNCRQLLSITELPPNLENLRASGCSSLRRIQNLSGLKLLEILELSHCSSLTEIVGLEGLTSIKQLHLEGCSSSCVINTLTKSLFQLFSQFGHKIHIHIGAALFPNWISKEISFGGSTEDLKVALRSSTLDLEMAPKMLNDSLFLGIILCFKPLVRHFRQYHLSKVKTMAHEYDNSSHKARMEILPTMLLLTDKDHTHELTDEDDAIVPDIFLLYKD